MFAKFSNIENYKKWAKEIVFVLKNSELCKYVDSTIIKLVFLEAKIKEIIFAEIKKNT